MSDVFLVVLVNSNNIHSHMGIPFQPPTRVARDISKSMESLRLYCKSTEYINEPIMTAKGAWLWPCQPRCVAGGR